MILVSKKYKIYSLCGDIRWGSSAKGRQTTVGLPVVDDDSLRIFVISVATSSKTLEIRPALLNGDMQSLAGL